MACTWSEIIVSYTLVHSNEDIRLETNLVNSAQNADAMAAVPENKHQTLHFITAGITQNEAKPKDFGGDVICRGARCCVPTEHSQRLAGVGRAEGEGGHVGQRRAGVQARFKAGLLLLLLLLLLLGDRARKHDGGKRIHGTP